MQVAVIGGTRHVGPHIVTRLQEAGHQVSVYNRGRTAASLPEGVEHVRIDRQTSGQLADALRSHHPEAVIDMIAYRVEQVAEVYEAAPDLRHYVFCSSTAVYGQIGRRGIPDETSPVAPDSEYSHGKAACDEWLMDKARTVGFPATCLRLAHPYGPGDHLLYTAGREALFLDRMRRQRPILIPGDGGSRIHPIYVADAARAFVHVLGRAECTGRVYNLAGAEILTLDEYFGSIARVLGVPLTARKLPDGFFRGNAALWAEWPRKFDFGWAWVNYESAFATAALEATGFRCEVDHDAGVAETLRWLEERELIPASSDDDEEDRILAKVSETG